MKKYPRTWVEVSSRALRHNLRQAKHLVPGIPILPVVKANAYGHDAALVCRVLSSEGIWGFGVAHGDEALALRQAGIQSRLLVLSSWQPDEVAPLVRSKTDLVAWDWQSLEHLQSVPASRPFIHLKLDTGTTRIGFLPPDIKKLISKIKPEQIAGVFSHLANAEEANPARTRNQIKHFATLSQGMETPWGMKHIACTAAIVRYPEAYFGLVRFGIGLYGLWSSPELKTWAVQHKPNFLLQPALHWYTRLIQVKDVPAGTSIGYGSTIKVRKKTRIGILPVGYYDGLDRRLSNRGYVCIRGKRAPIIGRVCMNLTMVDLGRSAVRPGAPVEILGSHVTAEIQAQQLGTIPYEVVSRINPVIQRILV